MPDSFQLVSAADVAAILASPALAPSAGVKPCPEQTTLAIRAAARVYAAEVMRTTWCAASHLHAVGFNADFVLRHWNTIKDAGETLVAERRRQQAAAR